MSKIELKRLELVNFKGAKKRTIEFGNERTFINGANATGKSTVLDAFVWLFFGRDRFDRSDFEIKTTDASGKPIPRIDHEVIGEFVIDGNPVTLRRTYREKWVKKTGEAKETFSGLHTTVYTINDVPKSEAEYNNYVKGILPQSMFKLVTVPTYFNSLGWKERREHLMSLASIPTDDVIAGDTFKHLISKMFNEKKSLADLKAEYAAKKTRIRKQLDEIPGRLDEVQRATPPAPDYMAIEEEQRVISLKIGSIDQIILDSSKGTEQAQKERSEAIKQKAQLEEQLAEIETRYRREITAKLAERTNKITTLKDDVKLKQDGITSLKARKLEIGQEIKTINDVNEHLRDRWKAENAKTFVFDENLSVCPTCHQDLPQGDVDKRKADMQAHFNEEKKKGLDAINNTGKENKAKIEGLQKQVALLDNQVEAKQQEIEQANAKIIELDKAPVGIESLQTLTGKDKAYTDLKARIEAVVIPEITVSDNDNQAKDDLTRQKQQLQTRLEQLQKTYALKAVIEQQQDRKAQLLKEEETLSMELAEMEKNEYDCDQFLKRKMEIVEDSVNKLFKTVKFRMFDTLGNGADKPACDCLVKGVPYPDANDAAKINSGIEILNVFAEKYGIIAPVFVDNAESVNVIEKPLGQLIAMYVTVDRELEIQRDNDMIMEVAYEETENFQLKG